MAATKVSLTVHLRDGSSQTISQHVGNGHETVRYDQLIKSLTNVQDQANNMLTTLVNQEKAERNGNHDNRTQSENLKSSDSAVNFNGESVANDGDAGNESESTDDEEEDEDDDSTDKPPEKKRKT